MGVGVGVRVGRLVLVGVGVGVDVAVGVLVGVGVRVGVFVGVAVGEGVKVGVALIKASNVARGPGGMRVPAISSSLNTSTSSSGLTGLRRGIFSGSTL